MIIESDGYFTDAGKAYINKSIDLFENYEYSKQGTLKIDNMLNGFNFYVSRVNDGFDVQLVTQNDPSQSCYMFGILFYTENSVKKAHV